MWTSHTVTPHSPQCITHRPPSINSFAGSSHSLRHSTTAQPLPDYRCRSRTTRPAAPADCSLLAPCCVLLYCVGPDTPDTRTATFSLALDATTRANGCLRFVDGSHLEPSIRPHRPVAEDREKAHAIMCQVNERTADNPNGELVSYVEVGRGDVTVHNERVVLATPAHPAASKQAWMAAEPYAVRRRCD